MNEWITSWLLGAEIPPGSEIDLAVGSRGLSFGWAFILFLVLGAFAAWSYRRWAAQVSPGRRLFLTALRLIVIFLFLLLLTQPVLYLTVHEPVRPTLLVAVDASQSMQLVDKRPDDADRVRLAIATGAANPEGGLKQAAPAELPDLSRADLLKRLAANERLRLWPRLFERSNLAVYSFGRRAVLVAEKQRSEKDGDAAGAGELTSAESAAWFGQLAYDQNLTALGDGLRQMLDAHRGQPVAGIFVLTDGANNSGLPPTEAANLARADGVPLFLYGIGITEPTDVIVRQITAPRVTYKDESMAVTVLLRAQGTLGKVTKVQLKAQGKVVAEKDVQWQQTGDTEVTLDFAPAEAGDLNLEAVALPLPGEAVLDNNSAKTSVRVVDDKLKVLYVEQEPRWDFRYLLATLRRDPRLKVSCFLVEGDRELANEQDSVFLSQLPADQAGWSEYDIIVLGDVDPAALGRDKMQWIAEGVGEAGVGMIFLAGPRYDPFAYAGTPLEPLLPVELYAPGGQAPPRYAEPVKLAITTTGEYSPYFQLSEDPAENRKIWENFPGVRWTAWVSRAKPFAQVLLVDPTPERASRGEPMPVVALQPFGQGNVLYFGFDETYRWRSKVGEKYYIQIWGQVIQSFSLGRQAGASKRTQLVTDRPRYFVGDRVIISGRVYNERFEPLADPAVQGVVALMPPLPDGAGAKAEEDKRTPVGMKDAHGVRLRAVEGRSGEYRGEWTPAAPGIYHFALEGDPEAVIRIEVLEPTVELAETAMNANLLEAMAKISSGQFLREENLHELFKWIAGRTGSVPTFRELEIFYSPWWLVLLAAIALTEWLCRRLMELK